MTDPKQSVKPWFLGIECGATHSVAVLAQSDNHEGIQLESGPANIRLLSDPQLVALFRKISVIHDKTPSPSALAIGMAGARSDGDRQRIKMAAEKVWPKATCYVTNDLETALATAEQPEKKQTQVLILSGTGSCCFGQTPSGKSVRVGGWGHAIGDKGSGYEIGLRALKAVVYYYDRDGVWPSLGQKILHAVRLNVPNQLIDWSLKADKASVAALAVEVFKAWAKKDKIATDIINGAAASLAADGAACAARLVKKGTPVQFVLSGSILLKQPKFAATVEHLLRQRWPRATVTALQRESVWGAVELARRHHGGSAPTPAVACVKKTALGFGQSPVTSAGLPATERRNPLSVNLDQLSIEDMITLMLQEDAKIPDAIGAERKKLERAVKVITAAFQKGGRLFYIGAGTSGRIGVLDASECPPTFRTPPEMVQGIMAGGHTALWKAVEGAEDDAAGGADALRFANVSKKDVVVGIAASGRTPFVWGALLEAKKRKAATMLICFNPSIKVAPEHEPDIIIAPDVGPEILTGSTRLKAGTATKLILNMLTTLSMVKLGKIISNLMVDMLPSNAKLRERAIRIVCEITGVAAEVAQHALEKHHWIIKDACKNLRKKTSAAASPAKSANGVPLRTTASKTTVELQLQA